MTEDRRLRILLVCSSGGHLAQLHRLRSWWSAHDRAWVTFDKADARSLLPGERVWWAHHPTTRNIPNLIRNTRLATRVVREYRPDVVISTGAGVAVPFLLWGRALGARAVFLEVFDRIDSPTLTGRMCYPFSDLFLVQWEEQRRRFPDALVVGRTF